MNTKDKSTAQAQALDAGIIDELGVVADSGTTSIYRGVKPGSDIRYCLCGCGLQVVKKAVYRPGHDARHVSEIVIAIVEAVENGKSRSIKKLLQEGLGQLDRPKLVAKAGERLARNLGEKHALTVAQAVGARLADLAYDEDDEGED